jgi:four helix bundle protein
MKNPARRHEDLITWQLCHRLRELVLQHTRSGAVATDYDYRRQLRRAVRSACYNTSEGFYRYQHGEFGHHLNIARGSLGEVLDQIGDGLDRGYFTPGVHLEMKRICLRAMKANVALRRSWKHPAPPL